MIEDAAPVSYVMVICKPHEQSFFYPSLASALAAARSFEGCGFEIVIATVTHRSDNLHQDSPQQQLVPTGTGRKAPAQAVHCVICGVISAAEQPCTGCGAR